MQLSLHSAHDAMDIVSEVASRGECEITGGDKAVFDLKIAKWCPKPKLAIITNHDPKILSLVLGNILNSTWMIDRHDFYIGLAARCRGISELSQCSKCSKWLLADLLILKPRLTIRVGECVGDDIKVVKEQWGPVIDIADPSVDYQSFAVQIVKINKIIYRLISPF